MTGILSVFARLCCAALVFLLATKMVCAQEVTHLSPDSFYIKLHMSAEPLLVDVRIPRQFREDRIHGAKAAPHSRILYQLAEGLDQEHPIFVYCQDVSRSGQASELLLEKGFKNIYLLDGGLFEWKLRGLPLDTSRRRSLKK